MPLLPYNRSTHSTIPLPADALMSPAIDRLLALDFTSRVDVGRRAFGIEKSTLRTHDFEPPLRAFLGHLFDATIQKAIHGHWNMNF